MIPSIKNILYVSDIGEGSRPAFRMAVSLAEQYDAKITFLHVIEPIPDSVRVTLESTLSADAYSLLQSDGAANLKEIIADRITAFCSSELEASAYKPKFDTVLAEGIIHRKIIEVAEKMSADMVVMGTRTHSATKQFFMGSTANKVMRHSDVPVLVVPLSS
ncbi:MAG: universal stress protein [Oceanospirillaceae bacterium]